MAEAPKIKHSTLDDAQGLSLGLFMCGLGVHVLTHAGLVTGQTAGIAVILSYTTGLSFGLMFFVINIPFYILAYFRLGRAFTLKSLGCVTALSLVTEGLPHAFQLGQVEPWLAALVFGTTVGMGMIALFRHNGSLGGISILALMVQDSLGFRAGYVQLIADVLIFAVAALLFPLSIIVWSGIGALVLNLIIAINHRRDRYIAT